MIKLYLKIASSSRPSSMAGPPRNDGREGPLRKAKYPKTATPIRLRPARLAMTTLSPVIASESRFLMFFEYDAGE